MPDINVNKLSEVLNTKADIDLNNTGVFSTSEGGGVNLTSSTPANASGKEVTSADFFQSNLLNYTTNRILEIPQDIKLELNNGTLTLKAGSKVYVPNEFEADGITPKFDVITVENDIEVPSDNSTTFIYYIRGSANFDNNIDSGTTFPSNPTESQKFYKIDENCIYRFDGTNWNKHSYSLPLGFCKKAPGSNNIVSIEQVFNGFGYIGRTAFLLPGVKFQTSQGKNTDGSIKTAVYTRSTVSITSLTTHTGHYYLMANDSAGYPFFIPKSQRFIQSYAPDTSNLVGINYWYNTSEERWYALNDDKTWIYLPGVMDIFGEASATDGLLYDFKGYPLNHINTYQRTELAGMCMPSTRYIGLTLGASSSSYTAPANGWFTCVKRAASAGQYLYLRTLNSNIGIQSSISNAGEYAVVTIPISAGDRCIVVYTATGKGDAERFRFVYAQGEQ